MSVINKSQIHGGFATIRTRGLHRSRSRVEQFEKLKPIVSKSDSVSLYENNNDLFYNFKTTSVDFNDVKRSVSKEVLNDFDNQFSSLTTSCNSFKHSNGCASTLERQNSSYENIMKSSPQPPISPCYESLPLEYNSTPPSPLEPIKENNYFLYERPESPTYGQIQIKEPVENMELYSLPPRVFTPTYYRKDLNTLDYALQRVVNVKPPIKSHSLQNRKSYSHPTRTIYEDPKNTPKYENGDHYYNSTTNYYSPSEISEQLNYKNASSSELLSDVNLTSFKLVNGFEKRFATLSYPKESQQQRARQRYSSQVDDSIDLEYLDPLDCKIGCQTTLRSKPRIPWYELAIKKESRRQSCPPMSTNEVIFVLYFFLLYNLRKITN